MLRYTIIVAWMYFTVATSYQPAKNQIINPPNPPSKVTAQPRTPNLASGINPSRGLTGSPGSSQLSSSQPSSPHPPRQLSNLPLSRPVSSHSWLFLASSDFISPIPPLPPEVSVQSTIWSYLPLCKSTYASRVGFKVLSMAFKTFHNVPPVNTRFLFEFPLPSPQYVLPLFIIWVCEHGGKQAWGLSTRRQ